MTGSGTERQVVVFLCTGNTARSQMAEALLRRAAPGRFDVHSAGLEPLGEVHPMTRTVLEEIGIDTSAMHPKGLQPFLGRRSVQFAIVVCEAAETSCPRVFPFALRTLHWPFPDPAAFLGSNAARLELFRHLRDRIAERIDLWLAEART